MTSTQDHKDHASPCRGNAPQGLRIMTYTPLARRLASLLVVALVATILVVLAMTQDRPYDHFRSTPATAVPKDDDCFYSPSDPYANVSVEAHGTTASGVGVWGAYVYPNRIGTVVASSPSAALAAAVRLERSVCWARQKS